MANLKTPIDKTPAEMTAEKAATKRAAGKRSAPDPRSTAAGAAEGADRSPRLADMIVEVAQLQRRLARLYANMLDYHESSGAGTTKNDGTGSKGPHPLLVDGLGG